MTLRDLTKRQLYNLRRKSNKEFRLFFDDECSKKPPIDKMTKCLIRNVWDKTWRTAYNKGLKAGLEFAK